MVFITLDTYGSLNVLEKRGTERRHKREGGSERDRERVRVKKDNQTNRHTHRITNSIKQYILE